MVAQAQLNIFRRLPNRIGRPQQRLELCGRVIPLYEVVPGRACVLPWAVPA